jgi:hypothetical protein
MSYITCLFPNMSKYFPQNKTQLFTPIQNKWKHYLRAQFSMPSWAQQFSFVNTIIYACGNPTFWCQSWTFARIFFNKGMAFQHKLTQPGTKISVSVYWPLVLKRLSSLTFRGSKNVISRCYKTNYCRLSTLSLHSPEDFSIQAAAENCFRAQSEFTKSIWLTPDTPQDLKRSGETHSSQVTPANRGRS